MNTIESLPTAVLITGHHESRIVTVAGKQLFPQRSQKLINHSPDGFSWGYGGSGPAQLSLAILLQFMPAEFACEFYQDFKWNVVAKWPKSHFAVTVNIQEEIKKIINLK